MASNKKMPTEEGHPLDRSRAGADNDSAGTSKPQNTSSASPGRLKRASTTPVLSAASSTTSSPKASRETSPTRPQLKPSISANSRTTRSRNNSQDLSPSRASSIATSNLPTVPSAAAIQRALSVAGTPQLQPTVAHDTKGDASKPQRLGKGLTGLAQSSGNPPRVKSPPPPANASKASNLPSKKAESAPVTPTIVLERATPSNRSSVDIQSEPDKENPPSGMRTPARGISGNGPALETVQESSLPSTPAIGRGPIGEHAANDVHSARDNERPDEEVPSKSKVESGSDSGGHKESKGKFGAKVTTKPEPTTNPSKVQVKSKKSFTQLLPSKAKVQEGSAKNMIVETETVSTIPQVALGGGAGERNITGRTDTSGSLRLKPSTETIRPKKEKKRVVRKAPSLNAGTGGFKFRLYHHHHIYSRPPSPDTSSSPSPKFPSFHTFDHKSAMLPRAETAPEIGFGDHSPVLTNFRGRIASSKADIFEAKVASAVDQTNSSDSEETFVYESNPPEPHSARPQRFHSRTPSATSMASQIDQYGARIRQDGNHSVAGKKSMKFANNSYHSFGLQDDQGTVRGPSQSGRANNALHHHHIGRFGRNGNGHTSLFDTESPFSNTSKAQRIATGQTSRVSSRPTTPRTPHFLRTPGTPRKAEDSLLYDIEGEGADDERAPLIGSVRTSKNRRRPAPGTIRNSYYDEGKHYHPCRLSTLFMSLGVFVILFLAAAFVLSYLCSKPLLEVRIRSIGNVLASEQEIMLDLQVHAINPNIITVQVNDLDINIFAKSKHVGTNALWRSARFHTNDGQIARKGSVGDLLLTPRRRPGVHEHYHSSDGVDEGTDPIDDPETDSQTMLLGRIFEFDSPLIFEPSPIRHQAQTSVGEVRLAKPGNRTEEGGTERWEKVLLHNFELIVRGVIRYSTPISSHTRSASIGGSVIVKPSEAIDVTGTKRLLLEG